MKDDSPTEAARRIVAVTDSHICKWRVHPWSGPPLTVARAYLRAVEALEDSQHAIQSIVQWCDAYPETIFLPISKEKMAEANEALKAIGVEMGAMHGQWARHLIGGIGDIARAALAAMKDEKP